MSSMIVLIKMHFFIFQGFSQSVGSAREGGPRSGGNTSSERKRGLKTNLVLFFSFTV